ncbi:hypothetical protein [Radiobacillus sp. PE A8.2]|uniref:hypothetical protein n=1 Tax=Radiobacillus sp. PE A8.2 TaxID=3380349 RepID=UPI00388D405C
MEICCEWCKKVLDGEVFIVDDAYCNRDCYLEWYVEVISPGYYTKLTEYVKEVN